MDIIKETGVGPCVMLSDDANPMLVRIFSEKERGAVYIKGERISGSFCCPRCGVHWPIVQDTEEWTDKGRRTKNGRIIMEPVGWGLGNGECPDCQIMVVSGWDSDYVIDLSGVE